MSADARLERLLALYGMELARHLRRIVRDDDAAEDLLQDLFLNAHKALPRLPRTANERAWLYRIATNLAFNYVRGRSRTKRALAAHALELDGAADDGSPGDHGDRHRLLWQKVATLPERQRVALTLRVADELDYEAIAERMGISAEAARANVYQATKKLKLEVRP